MIEPDLCYRALRSRDRRFDGRFFVAVRSTGVFCRPVCPARTPRRENCLFVPSAAAAREAGFRPCLRCRPEAAPGTPAWAGTSATVGRALRLIDAGALDHADVDALAARLGVGARHLRRLFARHVGASPRSVAQTRRVLFAKKLLDETDLPMVDVAMAAGYASVRRFNDAVRTVYGRSPRDLRRSRRTARLQPSARPRADLGRSDSERADSQRAGSPSGESVGSELTLHLTYRPPLAWTELLGFLALRAIPGVEEVAEEAYRRTVDLAGVSGQVCIRPAAREGALAVTVNLAEPAPLVSLVERLRRVFDLDADPLAIRDHLAGDRVLAPALRAHPGLRVPGAFDGFELAVRAILGQQVSVRGATTLAGRLAHRFGVPCPSYDAASLDRLFPTPERLARARVESIDLPGARAGAIRALSRAVAAGDLALDGSADPDETRARLLALPGIGEWTADYVAMRALREPDAFPAGDLGLRRAFADAEGLPSARALAARAEGWRPWRAYAALYLWQLGASATAAPSPASKARLRAAPQA